MPSVEVRGIQLHYDQHGTRGDPTVLIHGSLVDSSTWARVVPGLARGLTVLTYDRRGFGGSTRGPRDSPVATDAEDLAALLEATDFYPVHLVGHSYGAMVALRLAAEHPEFVRSLSLHEPPFFGLLADRPETVKLWEMFRDGAEAIRDQVRRGDRDGAARNVVEVFSSTPGAWERLPEGVRRSFAGYMDRWAEEYGDPEAFRPRPGALRETLVPALLTVGVESPRFLRGIQEALARELANPTVREIPRAGHAPHLTAPEEYVGLLLTFLLERNVPVA
ncbi:MAG TPA: alpha/beta hydrolase [Thermoplasmata archaeon]|nr:alpha/beta hydrolase [Thermoplasmata archaeon]